MTVHLMLRHVFVSNDVLHLMHCPDSNYLTRLTLTRAVNLTVTFDPTVTCNRLPTIPNLPYIFLLLFFLSYNCQTLSSSPSKNTLSTVLRLFFLKAIFFDLQWLPNQNPLLLLDLPRTTYRLFLTITSLRTILKSR